MIKVIGVTGVAGAGKSTVTRQLRLAFKIPILDADQAVRRLYQKNVNVIKEIEKLLPSVVNKGCIDRQLLKKMAFSKPELLEILEKIVHPFLLKEVQFFISKHYKAGNSLCVLDIPLLFEKGWEAFCYKTIAVYCDKNIQTRRLYKRGLMDFEIELILKKQFSAQEKLDRADYCLSSNLSKHDMFQQLQNIIQNLC